MTPLTMGGLEEQILIFIKHFLGTVGYPGIFVLMAVEGFGIPIPSELTMAFSGFLASSAGGDKMTLSVAIAVGTCGEVVGAGLAYLLGYVGGRPVLERYGRFVLVGEEELEKGEGWFVRYGDWIVLVSRMLPAIRSFIAFPAGVVRMPVWRFLLYSAVGSAIWCTALVVVGHQLGEHWQSVSKDIRAYEYAIFVLVAAALAYAAYVRLARHRSAGESTDDEEPPASRTAS